MRFEWSTNRQNGFVSISHHNHVVNKSVSGVDVIVIVLLAKILPTPRWVKAVFSILRYHALVVIAMMGTNYVHEPRTIYRDNSLICNSPVCV